MLIISWYIGQFQKTQGLLGVTDSTLSGSQMEGTAGSPLLWAHQLLLREETVFRKTGRREHVEARKKWVPQIKLSVAGTWRPLRKIREPVTTLHAPPRSHCAGKCPL